MSLVVFGSAKGAPGVTTLVLALAAVWPAGRRVVVVECDPDGGDIAAWYRLATTPGLMTLAAQARQGLSPAAIWTHTQQLPGDGDQGDGVGLVVAPPGGEQATAATRALAAADAAEQLAMGDTDVLIDAGRLRPESPVLPLLARSAATVLVLRGEVGQVAHARARIPALAKAGLMRPAVLLVGDRPYTAEQIAAAVDAPVAGVIADDPRGARALAAMSGGPRVLRRSLLVRSAATVAQRLCRSVQRPRLAIPHRDDTAIGVDAR